MKGFIELIMKENKGKLLISISSISMVEEFPKSTSRIVLKERVEESGINLTALVSHSYLSVKQMIEQAAQQ